MKSTLREFSIGVCGSLFATFLLSYVSYFIQPGNTTNINDWFVDMVITYKFIIIWAVILFFVLIVRHMIKNWIDKQQEPYPMVYGIAYSYDITYPEVSYKGFKWKVSANIKDKDPFTNEVKDIKVQRVDGAYCYNDFREMKVTRTYLGRYKYKCPKCGYKKVLLKNNHSLQCELEDEIEATFRHKQSIQRQA